MFTGRNNVYIEVEPMRFYIGGNVPDDVVNVSNIRKNQIHDLLNVKYK